MLMKMMKSIAPILIVALFSIPALAQVPVPVPNLEIHIAHSHPPHLRHERRPSPPGEGYLWVAGYWDWQGNQWGWVPGRWDRPAERGVVWVQPRYQRESGYYRYEPGHWSNQRVVDGEDYRHWKEGHRHRGRGHDRDRDGDRDRDRDER